MAKSRSLLFIFILQSLVSGVLFYWIHVHFFQKSHLDFLKHTDQLTVSVENKINQSLGQLEVMIESLQKDSVLAEHFYQSIEGGRKESLVSYLQFLLSFSTFDYLRVMNKSGEVVYRSESTLKNGDRVEDEEEIFQIVNQSQTIFKLNQNPTTDEMVLEVLGPIYYFNKTIGYISIGMSLDKVVLRSFMNEMEFAGIFVMDKGEVQSRVIRKGELFLDPYIHSLEGRLGIESTNEFIRLKSNSYRSRRFFLDQKSLGEFWLFFDGGNVLVKNFNQKYLLILFIFLQLFVLFCSFFALRDRVTQ